MGDLAVEGSGRRVVVMAAVAARRDVSVDVDDEMLVSKFSFLGIESMESSFCDNWNGSNRYVSPSKSRFDENAILLCLLEDRRLFFSWKNIFCFRRE